MVTAVVLVAPAPLPAEVRSGFATLARSCPSTSLAFLSLAEPPLTRELSRLADLGTERIHLVTTGAQAASGRSWVRRVAAHWLREHGGSELLLAPEVLTEPDADRLAALLAAPARAVTGREAGLTSAAWENVPGHRHQVFVCQGVRCLARGADVVVADLYAGLESAGLGDDDVLVTATGCQFPCNHAPLLSVQPDDVWYGDLDTDAVASIVEEHLARPGPLPGGRARAHRLPRPDATRCYAGQVRTISQRELRNDNAVVIRAVEQGETFTVTRRGVPVARLAPVQGDDDLRCVGRASARPDYVHRSRPRLDIDVAGILADLRGER
jgi:prevent-host-death family protein